MSESLLEKISRELSGLSRSERRIAECILADPQAASSMNQAELAALASVSEPTLSRFCQRFGGGFSAFRVALTLDVSTGAYPATGGGGMDPAARVIRTLAAAIRGLERDLDRETLRVSTADLAAASVTMVLADQGGAGAAADFTGHMLELGRRCLSITEPGLSQAAVKTLAQGDALVLVSAGGDDGSLIAAAGAATAKGVPVTVLCPTRSRLSTVSGRCLSFAERSEGDGADCVSTSQVCLRAILEILLTRIAGRVRQASSAEGKV